MSLSPARMAALRGARRSRGARERHDFYPTPAWATEALLDVEHFARPVWECACGAGHMARVLQAAGLPVVATDLVDRGFGEARVDFLREASLRAPNIVTNPPYKLAGQFARHALALGAEKLCLLVQLSFMEGVARARALFTATPPARVWVFARRPGFAKRRVVERGGGNQAFAWIVWDRWHAGPPTLGWLMRGVS